MGTPRIQAIHQPDTVEAAISLLQEHGERARPLAGGTSLALSRSSRIDALVDLRRAGLTRIDHRGAAGLTVGAMATCNALRRSLAAGGAGEQGTAAGALHEALDSLASRVLRNHITVGGNCVMAYAWSDLPVALSCLEARFTLRGPDGERTLAADELFERHPSRSLGPAELMTAVHVPAAADRSGSAYAKLTHNAGDHAVASVAAAVTLDADGRTVRTARVLVGGVRALPQRMDRAAEAVTGSPMDLSLIHI